MIKTQMNALRIITSTNANHFIYYFKRLPFIGKLMPDSIYANLPLKKMIAVIALIDSIIGNFLKKALYVGIMLLFPIFLLTKKAPGDFRFDCFVYLLFVLNLIVGSFALSTVCEGNREKYICIRLMRMSPKSYLVSSVMFHYLTEFIYFLPTLIVASVWLGGSVFEGFILTLLLLCSRFMGEAFHLLIYSKLGVLLSQKAAFGLIFLIVGFAAAYAPVALHRILFVKQILFSIPFILCAVAVAGVSAYYIVSFKQYKEIAAATLKSSELLEDVNKILKEASFDDVKIRNKDFSEENLKSGRFNHKKGYAYLNALFFERHKRLLLKPVFIRVAVIAAAFAVCLLASFVFPESSEVLIKLKDGILPISVFIMYSISIGERVCKAMFYNCDISLMRYSFYHDKNAILYNFKVRLFKIAKLNLITACSFCTAVLGLFVMRGVNWPSVDLVFFVLSILFLSLFFSVHHLFLYYVFQPYTTELQMKNPYFKIIDTVVYLLCFLSLRIDSPPPYFALIVLSFTIIYIIVALILVYKLAPKTFRVK